MNMKESELSKAWFIGFVLIAIAALAVFIWAYTKKDVTVMVATGMVAGVQLINVVKWLKAHKKENRNLFRFIQSDSYRPFGVSQLAV